MQKRKGRFLRERDWGEHPAVSIHGHVLSPTSEFLKVWGAQEQEGHPTTATNLSCVCELPPQSFLLSVMGVGVYVIFKVRIPSPCELNGNTITALIVHEGGGPPFSCTWRALLDRMEGQQCSGVYRAHGWITPTLYNVCFMQSTPHPRLSRVLPTSL